MRTSARLLLCLALAAVAGAGRARAGPVEVALGSEIRKLQDLVDRRYGVGRIDVRRDFIGAHAGDPDPWLWLGERFGVLRLTLLQMSPDVSVAGWYLEHGTQPLLPPGNGALFRAQTRPREEALLVLTGANAPFGFYIQVEDGVQTPGGSSATRRFFTNRTFNTSWSYGQGTIGPPFSGRVQALIFDVSRWVGHDTWLVCFEDMDAAGTVTISDGSVPPPGSGEGGASRVADNDFDDVVFEVSVEGATLARALSFGSLKLRYR